MFGTCSVQEQSRKGHGLQRRVPRSRQLRCARFVNCQFPYPAPRAASDRGRAGRVVGGGERAEAPANRDRRQVGRLAPRPPRPRFQRRNMKSRLPESQRDSVTQPKVAESARLPWVNRRNVNVSYPNGVMPSVAGRFAATPLGLVIILMRVPRVARSSQPLG